MAIMIRETTITRKKDMFLDLVKAFPLKPIRAEADHEAASQMLRQLVWSKPIAKLTDGERDYLEALTILMRDYQQKQQAYALAAMTPREILRHFMDESGMSVTDLGRVIGNRSAA